jgi:undecaprenyl diphosphate synthase
MAYTELYFADCYWPDFDAKAMELAIAEYYSRQRRFGLRSDESRIEGQSSEQDRGETAHV